MRAALPRIEISLSKIYHNSRVLSKLYGLKGISLMGVSKATLGDPQVAQAMIQGGVKFIADSRIENIKRLREGGTMIPLVLLRTALSEAEDVVNSVDISLNSEVDTVIALSRHAKASHTTHGIIIMVELGDLREGVLPCDLSGFIKHTLQLPNIHIAGIGCNLACFGGIKPDANNMTQLSELVDALEHEHQIKLNLVSGGNSANYEWHHATQTPGRINNLRVGESILLGRETTAGTVIPGLHSNAFKLFAEVIEAKHKPSRPFGTVGQDAFGTRPNFTDSGIQRRVILALGRQDALISGLTPESELQIVGSSSDHLVLEDMNALCKVGDEVGFDLNYGALLSAMTSQFVAKQFVGSSLGSG
jgi:predicted amino acid racemase